MPSPIRVLYYVCIYILNRPINVVHVVISRCSSSAASSGGYPNQAPPASPSTTVARGYNHHRSTASLGYGNHHANPMARGQREYQGGGHRYYTQHRQHRQHPPTPASTDINDESDFYAVGNGNPIRFVSGSRLTIKIRPTNLQLTKEIKQQLPKLRNCQIIGNKILIM